MEFVTRIMLAYENVFQEQPLNITEYLKQLPRELCIRYGLLISNYTKDDDICTQFKNLGFDKFISCNVLAKLKKGRLSIENGYYVLFTPQTGLEILKYVFSIPASEFRGRKGQRFSLIPLLKAILKVNSDLLSQGSHFRDKSLSLFVREIRSHKYGLDDRIIVYPLVYRMFCLLHFFEQNKGTKWSNLQDKLVEELGVVSLREYFSKMLWIIGKCNMDPKPQNHIFRCWGNHNYYSLLDFFSLDMDATIELENNQDYTSFKERPIVKLRTREYGVISNAFLAYQLYHSLKFRMSDLCKTKKLFNFFSMFNNDFIEKYLLNQVLDYAFKNKGVYLTEEDCEKILSRISQSNPGKLSKSDKEGLPDGYIRCSNKILLIECKAKTISSKSLQDERICIEAVNSDIVNEKHGTGQLINNCTRILEGHFFVDENIPSDFQVYPLLIVDDLGFSSRGFNKYVVENTKNFVNEHAGHIRQFTVLDMDTLILIVELIKIGEFDIFDNIESYHTYIEGGHSNYSMNEIFDYSDVSFASYIYDKYETRSPEIIDKWYETL